MPVARLAVEIRETARYDKQVNAAIMKELGWKRYGDDTNMPDVPYMGEEGLKRTKGFQDDRLQIFHPAFKSRMLINCALGELEDVGLKAEVIRFRHWANEQDKKHQRRIELEAEILHTEQEYHASAHYLIQARTTLRVGNQTFTHAIQMPAPLSRPHPTSPALNHTPLFTASPGPIERANTPSKDRQGKVTFTLAQKGKCKRSHYCLICKVEEDHTNRKCKDHCSWCGDEEHTSDLCEDPHI
jgi:hypothetical protein